MDLTFDCFFSVLDEKKPTEGKKENILEKNNE